MDYGKKSYFRTLIFTVISAIFSLALFGILFFKPEYKTFVITVEIGIFSIITYVIYNIVQHEKLLSQMSDPSRFRFTFDSCPDYYIKRTDNSTNKDFCSNEYIVVDKESPLEDKLIMKIVDENTRLPSNHSPTFLTKDANTGVSIQPDKFDKFMLDDFFSPELTSIKDRCDVINPNVVTEKDKFQGYKNIPWTNTRSRCDGLYGKYERKSYQ
jgi:hypothetical protein